MLLSVAIPCYNSEEYMDTAINSALYYDNIEILIINDGSNDDTLSKGIKWSKKYPNNIKVINQENGGHGYAVMSGIKNATGKYFKVLDSDDKFDKESLKKIINTLLEFEEKKIEVDLVLSNYVYDKVGVKHKKVVKYNNIVKEGKVTSFDNLGRFRLGQYILMHSVIYNTNLLKKIKLNLPKHTFYVDNIYVYYPLPYVKSIYYINTDFYRYYIGREDQSVNEKVMISRVDQQIKVTRLMIEMHNIQSITSKKLRKYMINYLNIMMTVSSILLIIEGSKKSLDKKKELWEYLQKKDPYLYKKIRKSIFGIFMNIPTKFGRKVSIYSYKIAKEIVGFN